LLQKNIEKKNSPRRQNSPRKQDDQTLNLGLALLLGDSKDTDKNNQTTSQE